MQLSFLVIIMKAFPEKFIMIKLFFDSFLTTLSEVVTVWGFVYALPIFINNLKIQNNSETAAEAIKLLSTVNKHVEDLIKSVNNNRESRINNLYFSLSELQAKTNLLPLSSETKNKFKIQLLDPLILPSDNSEKMILFFERNLGEDWRSMKEEHVKIPFLEKLHDEFQQIYKNPSPRKWKNILWLIIVGLIINFLKNIYGLFFS